MNVYWETVALDRLADIYVDETAEDRQSMATTVEYINLGLASNPYQLGESRDEDERVWFHHPLMISFVIVPEENEVMVTGVKRLNNRR